ncbi:MAG: hypothetical protein LBU65_08420, partial [Planctomycetaceae bacterium]|nr:hypothetical protein [Planctomycetaceae bacterium]
SNAIFKRYLYNDRQKTPSSIAMSRAFYCFTVTKSLQKIFKIKSLRFSANSAVKIEVFRDARL